MKFNTSTIILIVILLLLIYLLDNIKSLEDNLLSKKSINLHSRKKYFQDINISFIKQDRIPKNNIEILPAVLPNHVPSMAFIKPEKSILIPSEDKHISGVSAPGSTVMVMEKWDNIENPVYINNI
jgi:hypothetical protein